MKKIRVNATTGETEEVDLTPEEIAEHQALVDAIRGEVTENKRLALVAKNEALLHTSFLQVFARYLELHLQDKLPPMKFPDFMNELFTRYVENGGTITP